MSSDLVDVPIWLKHLMMGRGWGGSSGKSRPALFTLFQLECLTQARTQEGRCRSPPLAKFSTRQQSSICWFSGFGTAAGLITVVTLVHFLSLQAKLDAKRDAGEATQDFREATRDPREAARNAREAARDAEYVKMADALSAVSAKLTRALTRHKLRHSLHAREHALEQVPSLISTMESDSDSKAMLSAGQRRVGLRVQQWLDTVTHPDPAGAAAG